MAAMPKGPEKLQAAGMHKSFGVILLVLILLRFAWKLLNSSPKPPPGTTTIEHFLAQGMHWLLYALMFAQPLSGVLMSQAAGYPVSVFGVFELPALIEKDPETAKLLRSGHGVIWIVLALAVAGHIAAAMFHHLVRKDNVLRSMTVGSKI
jgi:cytochrome b561